jgi:NADH dehydrogenase
MGVVIIGGGYAGLATLIALRHSLPTVEIHLVDPREHHLKLTHLHQTLGRPLSDFLVPFARLAAKYQFTHHRAAVTFSKTDLVVWQQRKQVPLPTGPLAFDFLVIATGAHPHRLPVGGNVVDQDTFCAQDGTTLLSDRLARTAAGERQVAVVGAGATGIQFLFELHHRLPNSGVPYHLTLISRRDRILPELPEGFHAYISRRLREAGIEHLSQAKYVGPREGGIELRHTVTGATFIRPSALTLLFPGVTPYPQPLRANRYGRVLVGRQVLSHIFTAGDCSVYHSSGLNSLTAQAAVRKGKQIATNIRRVINGRLPYIYSYDERGYFVSLGPFDGIGWLLFKANIVTGLPAFFIKETLEAQYDLFLDGVDLYF